MASHVDSVACILLLASALVTGCGGGSEPAEIDLVHVSSHELGVVQAGRHVFRVRSDWEAFWAAHPHLGYPARQTPSVDFATVAVAGVFAGPKGRCNRLDIVSGSRLQGSVTLRYRISTFGAGTPSSCIGNDAFTLNLADFVLIPRESTEVKFESE
jgi:hypothetical protein